MEEPKRTIGSFTRSQLEEFAKQPNVVVYEPSHTMHFTPWTTDEIDQYITQIIEKTKAWSGTSDALRKNLMNETSMCEFAARYKTFFEKLTDPRFVNDDAHVQVMRQIVSVKSQVDSGTLTEDEAKTKCADIALTSLIKRTM